MDAASFGRIFGKTFFPIALFAFLFSYTFVEILEPENFSSLVSKTLGQSENQQLGELANSLRQACSEQETIEVPERNISIDCNEVEGKSDQELLLLFADKIIDSQTTQYDCGFIECTMQIFSEGLNPENILFFLSDTARNFFERLMLYSLIAAVALGIILFASIKEWRKRFSTFGKTFLSASLPFVIIFALMVFALPSFLPAEFSAIIGPIAEEVLSSVAFLYLGLLVGGVALLLVGRLSFKLKS